jgi:3-hydroxyacyl-[acyl-carrier-protein] dehydratase
MGFMDSWKTGAVWPRRYPLFKVKTAWIKTFIIFDLYMDNLLLEDFYSIQEISSDSPEKMTVKVELNAAHPVYKGHFPGTPVAPGVCLIQMIKEILIGQQKRNLQMTDGDTIKFMALIDPARHNSFYIDYELRFPSPILLEATAIIRWDAVTYLKFKGKFKTVA